MCTNQNTGMDAGHASLTVPETVVRQPVLWWAGAGAVFLALQAYVLLSWVLSPDFASRGTGVDPVPAQVRTSAWISQFNSVVAFLVCAIYCVRRSRREGCLTWDALLMIGGLSVCWLDTAINYFRSVVLYNAYMLNWGSWNAHIPGWASGSAHPTPEPLVFVTGLYGWWFLLFSAVFCGVARRLELHWPRIGVLGLVLAGVVTLSLLDALLELIFVFSGLYAYAAVVPGWTLWLGTVHQFPLYGPLILGVLCTIVAMLRYGARKQRYSFVERGSDELPVSAPVRTAIRILAIVGFMNTVFVIAVFAHWWIGSHAEGPLPVPSYLVLDNADSTFNCVT
ncbi:spirocyclase AveC family protein [Paraburkholderia tuberum]|uniref:Spirocyclase, AveC family n=1 Tax=Paraburkholderia tuberum TaxID=157910 RepID=A0A1H1KJP2_9BURK|nr:spirocyclase AveC family protein [Paraburkholderia tuberum]SDR62581.1 hypothetical protein SAMN05445850_8281 [Paraburkholderia tuberum]